MQFKHPEILWALFLLVIPVVIHLFQLRRFSPTPFTNVAMLQKLVSESRRSDRLKKWLLLATRLLLLTALIIAFAQPLASGDTVLKERETVIYLDNSFSMQARADGSSLLARAVQELIKGLPPDGPVSLFTNGETFDKVRPKDIRDRLLSLSHVQGHLALSEIHLKARALFSDSGTDKHLIVISDFQRNMQDGPWERDRSLTVHYVPQRPGEGRNIALDSLFLEEAPPGQLGLVVLLSGGGREQTLPVSLYNGEELIAKTAATFSENGTARLTLSIMAQEEIQGRLAIVDQGLAYDNNLYFSLNAQDPVKVLAIGSGESDYLDRLYAGDVFTLKKYAVDQFNHSELDGQQAVVVEGLQTLPENLQLALQSFARQGGSLIVIPPDRPDIASYNRFFSTLGAGRYLEPIVQEAPLTGIAQEHPLYRGVFQGEVDNFDYPRVGQHLGMRSDLPAILTLEGGDAFLRGRDGLYVFTASLDRKNTDFKNSPLIVPTFYRMALSGAEPPELYHIVGSRASVDLRGSLGPDDVLRVANDDHGFIPLQRAFPNRIRLTFGQNPDRDGGYGIFLDDRRLKHISFNYPREESRLEYMDLEGVSEARVQESLVGLFDHWEAEGQSSAYWKWFVILALFLILVETLIQKFVSWKSY